MQDAQGYMRQVEDNMSILTPLSALDEDESNVSSEEEEQYNGKSLKLTSFASQNQFNIVEKREE